MFQSAPSLVGVTCARPGLAPVLLVTQPFHELLPGVSFSSSPRAMMSRLAGDHREVRRCRVRSRLAAWSAQAG